MFDLFAGALPRSGHTVAALGGVPLPSRVLCWVNGFRAVRVWVLGSHRWLSVFEGFPVFWIPSAIYREMYICQKYTSTKAKM